MMTDKVPESAAVDVGTEKGGGDVTDVVIDVGGGEEVCRICHLMREASGGKNGSEKIRIGCGCKGELGFAHRDCGEAWFRVRGNRLLQNNRISGPLPSEIGKLSQLMTLDLSGNQFVGEFQDLWDFLLN